MNDLLTIVALTVGGCLVVGLVGGLLLHLLRRRSFRHLLTIATLIPVVAVAVTVLVNVRFMFLSAHDSAVVLVALGISLLLAVFAAYLVTRRLVQGSRHVGAALHQLVEDTAGSDEAPPPSAAAPVLPQELARVVDDLAETRRTLAESRARERMAEQARRELVSFMSHDLRTPLAGLRALTEGLEDGVIADPGRALAQMRGTVDRMSGLVDDLFALSRVQGQPKPKPGTLVSLTELITDVANELTASAAARAVELRLEVPADDRLAVVGAADDLTRALTNLVANAIRHTDPGAQVQLVGRRTEAGGVQVAVIDGCGGIPEASLRRVFDTGWRGTPSRSGDDGGAGLGLAIARGVVESHQGEIAVRNVEGGCRFEVDLPALSSPRR
jgi:signal transduction histidine kinase